MGLDVESSSDMLMAETGALRLDEQVGLDSGSSIAVILYWLSEHKRPAHTNDGAKGN